MGLIINESLISGIDFAPAVSGALTSGILIADRLYPEDLSICSGDVWECWALNGPQMEPSVYSGMGFNSYGELDGCIYGAKEEGIYLMEGATDDGATIHTGVVLGPMSFAGLNRVHFRRLYFGITGTAPVLQAEADGTLGASTAIMRGNANLPRTQYGKKWSFLVGDFDEMERIELSPVVITRTR